MWPEVWTGSVLDSHQRVEEHRESRMQIPPGEFTLSTLGRAHERDSSRLENPEQLPRERKLVLDVLNDSRLGDVRSSASSYGSRPSGAIVLQLSPDSGSTRKDVARRNHVAGGTPSFDCTCCPTSWEK